MTKQLAWQNKLRSIHLPRWEELPDIELYMDQLVTLVERYTSPFKVVTTQERLLTAAMVNNYVKQKLIPSPSNKKYDRRHLARLIIITILKQAFDLPVVTRGIEWQMNTSDYKLAYNQFCKQMEETLQLFLVAEGTKKFELDVVPLDYQPIQMATISLASKLVAENTLNALTINQDLPTGGVE